MPFILPPSAHRASQREPLGQHATLVPQRDVLEHQVGPAAARQTKGSEQQDETIPSFGYLGGDGENVNDSGEDKELAKTGPARA